ncbi:putative esterase [Rhizobium leguminosarum bv. trifolii WSM2297]|uniref:Putative esterase n=1 Tax=Rhizobium leguminosarum bv. trifolii WSM2297 TaxID=754762 RepID=J0C8T8_RHILT|nr:alpha/beta fold hydrolase [Rhizobium leguminosarum]EJC79437.1 putative esterase [Rhizobium leguminosarum bv. trifolii WSM2297]
MPESQDFLSISERAELDAAPLVLLHGSGMHERNLIPLADRVAPDRPFLTLRGALEWEEGFAFFRRNPDRTLDYADLFDETHHLGDFLVKALETGLLKRPPVLLGFSNGAIIAASVLLHRPETVAGAILLRPLSPAPAADFPDLRNHRVLILAGERDERRAPEDVVLVRDQIERSGAGVTTRLFSTGHDLDENEPDFIRDWLAKNFPPA